MPATKRQRRWWFIVLTLGLGSMVFSYGMLLSSPMWYDRCEEFPVFSSLHCAAPFLLLGSGALLLVAGGALLLIQLVFRRQ
jgi:hypothetical protein